MGRSTRIIPPRTPVQPAATPAPRATGIEQVRGVNGLEGGGTLGTVEVSLTQPVPRESGGTGISAVSNTQLLTGIGALPRAGGSMTGNLSVAGAIVGGPAATPNLGPGTLVLNGSASGVVPVGALPAGGMNNLQIIGGDAGAGPRLIMDAYGGSAPNIIMRHGNGVASAFTATVQGNIGIVGFAGATGNDTWEAVPGAWIVAVASQNWNATQNGTHLDFSTTAFNTTDLCQRLTIRGGLIVPGATGTSAVVPDGGTNSGDMGPGTINVRGGYYVNGVPLTAGSAFNGGTVTTPIGVNLNADPLVGADPLVPLHVAGGATNQPTPVFIDNFSNNTNHAGTIWFRKAPNINMAVATVNNDMLGALNFTGHVSGPTFPGTDTGVQINARATQAWNAGAHGCALNFWTTPNNSPTIAIAMTLDGDGDLHLNRGSVGPSDRRLKKNIEPWQRGLEEVRRLNPISFEYNGRGGIPANGHVRVSVDADDVNEVIPEMVTRSALGEIDGTPIKAIRPEVLTYALINAVKELVDRLETIEARLGGR